MRMMILATAASAVAVPTVVAAPAEAQTNSRYQRELRECNRELRRSDSRREYRQELNECRRELRRAQSYRTWRSYDYNRYEPGYSRYYADRYYRSGSYYPNRRLTRYDRIYRGNDGRYYCRRNDGTTGLIIGGAVGALIGRELDRGGSRTVGTIIGAGAGALLGREIARGSLHCD